MPKLHVRPWSEEDFAGSRIAWQQLLEQSDADPLFMSWDWQWRWWRHHVQSLGATLQLLGVYDAAGELAGLGPFYSHSVTTRGVLRACRLELVGGSWRASKAIFSDYLDLIIRRDCRPDVIAALGDWLAKKGFWQEMVLVATPRLGAAAELLHSCLRRSAYVREVDPLAGWRLDLPESFDEYLKALDSGTRRKLFNQRGKLPGLAVESAGETELEEYLTVLWRYSRERWGGSMGGSGSEAFLTEIVRHWARSGQLRLTRLRDAAGTLSIMLNVRIGDCLYYLQSGFDARRARGISPGYLHFGCSIEAACNEGVRHFDLLAGTGRHRDYKRELLTESVPVVTYHVVTGWRRVLYGSYERLMAGRPSCL